MPFSRDDFPPGWCLIGIEDASAVRKARLVAFANRAWLERDSEAFEFLARRFLFQGEEEEGTRVLVGGDPVEHPEALVVRFWKGPHDFPIEFAWRGVRVAIRCGGGGYLEFLGEEP